MTFSPCLAGPETRCTLVRGGFSVGEKRLTVTFPAGHPVWSFPKGQQSAKVREWVDTALGLAVILEGIRVELQGLRNSCGPRAGDESAGRSDGFSEFVKAFKG